MSTNILILLELALILGVVFGLGFWQLAALRRDRLRREEARRRERTSPPEASRQNGGESRS